MRCDYFPDPGALSVPMSPVSGADLLSDPDHRPDRNSRVICVICHIPDHSLSTFHQALIE